MNLGINIDHIATLRNVRGGVHPSPARALEVLKTLGISLVTIHLREDRRHIRDTDVAEICLSGVLSVNLEIALTEEMLKNALKYKPNWVCIVPENRHEITTEGGLDVKNLYAKLQQFIPKLQASGIKVSLFIEPCEETVRLSAQLGVDAVEIHTGKYSHLTDKKEELERIYKAAQLAGGLGLEVHAGHGLNYENVADIAKISYITELNIGHFLVGEAVFVGLENAVRQMQEIIERNRPKIGFVDSGTGGLIFAMDFIKALNESGLKQAQMIHIGDTKNVPYGLKKPNILRDLTQNLIQKAVDRGAKIVIIACNTAVTAMDEAMIHFFEAQGVKILTIIEESAKTLYNNARVVDGEVHLAVFGTDQTIKSRRYEEALRLIHGANPEKLTIHTFSPLDWEQNVEDGITEPEITKTVEYYLGIFKAKIGADFDKISALGLFCTHYPYFKSQIQAFLGINITVVSQGAIFAEPALSLAPELFMYPKPEIKSYITGGNLETIKTVINTSYPLVKVDFKQI
jgi:pyridoxine 5-phosphate synthase